MEPAGSRIQVLLQAAEFLEHREHRHPLGLAGAEHGYAALCPAPPRRASAGRVDGWVAAGGGGGADHPGLSRRSVHNALEKHRYGGVGRERRGRAWEGPCLSELRARRAKDRLRDRQRCLQRRLESLLLPADGERARADSLDSSQLSEPSEEGKEGRRKKQGGQGGRAAKGLTRPSPCPEDAEVEVDGVVFSGDLLPGFGTGREHSYSSPHSPAS
ncbi:MAD3 protein, partial [Calcarius ornatus]|nr:MAD3 protein [Calcarius ornatus]